MKTYVGTAMLTSNHVTLFLTLVTIVNGQLEYTDKRIGPFRIVTKQIAQCDEKGLNKIRYSSTRVRKAGRDTLLYSTNVTFEVPIDDNLEGLVDTAILGNGGWRPHFLQIEFYPCSTPRKYMPRFFKIALQVTGVKDCPFPAGTYEVKDVQISGILPVKTPVFPYGNYRSDVMIKSNGSLLGCGRTFYDILPLNTQKKKSH